MDHRRISLAFLRTSGLIPVKVRPQQKDPFPEWDPRRAATEDHGATLRLLEADESLNLGALFHGKYVDVDIDTNMGALHQALDHFLPRTPYVWGRKSKPASHRAYQLHEDFDRGPYGPILRFLKSLKIGDDNYSVELRGGRPENGLFSVLPGSTHPSGEAVEWADKFDPTVSGTYVETHRLVKALRLAQATSLIASYYVSGVRNDMSLALAGLLWRIRSSSMAAAGLDDEMDIKDGMFILTEDDARAVFDAVTKIADDNQTDHRARQLNYINSWKKLDTDPAAKVTGGKVLAELIGKDGDKVVKALYRLLSDNEGIEQMEALAEQFTIWYGPGVLIDLIMVDKGHQTPWMTKEQAGNSLGGRKVTLGDKKIPIVNLLFGSQFIQRVAGLTFDPSTTDRLVQGEQGTMVNQWKGFTMEPCPQTVMDEDVRPFIDYVYEVLAAGEEKMATWILDWMADMLQKPANKPGTALVLVGPQGAGKTFLGERILAPIIGKSHSVQMNSIEQLTNKFNSLADNKIFVQCDEAVHSYQKDVAARLKSIITDETMTVEPKNVNAFKKPNHMHFLFTSNEENTALFIDPTPHERRFTVQKVSAKRCDDIEYWTFMHKWVEMALPKVMRWLLDRQYVKRNIQRPLETEAKRNIQRVGVDPEIAWIIGRVAAGFPISHRYHIHWWQGFSKDGITENEKKNGVLRRDVWPDRVHLNAIEEDYRAFVRSHGRPVYSGSIITTLKRALPPESLFQAEMPTVSYLDPKSGASIKERVRLYGWPSTNDILQHLRHKFGPLVDKLIEEAREDAEPEQTPEPEEEF